MNFENMAQKLGIYLISFLLFYSCGKNGTDESKFYSDGLFIPEGQTVTYELLKSTVLDPWDCLTCHGPGGGGLSWGANDNAIRQTILTQKIVPGDPDASSLYIRSEGNTSPMPPLGHSRPGPVDARGLEYIRRFIDDQSP